jgi:arsenate reductase
LIRHEVGERFEVFSAGTRPTQLRKEAVLMMRELEIDISAHRSKPLTEFAGQEFDFVITVVTRRVSSAHFSPEHRKGSRRPFEDPTAFTEGERN